ncbi:hypothetical protein EUX98_g8607 [Antrodiella citrinella]|uniref:C2 domain-containing protein n=1 Tax=Antrodiella citrinella TaxID=2447956 RepID=A0A4S4M553_9APHY|nr:hypothetical protein EUX98_g8607 [Antrodiella citrinella]
MFAKLNIISAAELTPRQSCIPSLPNCYVRVVAGGAERETGVVERSDDPLWKEEFMVPVKGDDMSVDIQLWHKSTVPLRSYKIGGIEILWPDLLKLQFAQQGKPIRLSLTRKKIKGDVGHVLLTAAEVDDTSAGKTAVKSADGETRLAKLDVLNDDMVGLLQSVANKLNDFTGMLNNLSQLHPLASVAFGIVANVVKAINAQVSRDIEIIGLIKIMDEANSFLGDFRGMQDITPRLTGFVSATLKQTVECSSFIREYCHVGFMTRLAQQSFNSSSAAKIVTFKKAFQDLQSLRVEGATVQSVVVSYRVLDVASAIRRDQVLERLRAANMDTSGRPSCLPNTRIQFQKDLTNWVMTPSEQNILYLYGVTGSGKSTLATTVANFFRELHRLGAFLFFSRKPPHTTEPSGVIRTLAAQLALFDARIGQAIASAIEQYPGATEGPLASQFKELLVKPLNTLDVDVFTKDGHAMSSEGPILIVLDALDECGDTASRAELMDVLVKHTSELPSWLRFIFTSRPDKDISLAMESCPNVFRTPLDVKNPANIADVAAYVRNTLGAIRTAPKNRNLGLGSDWPGEDAIRELSRRAAGLFVWATTACSFIDSHNPRTPLNALLKGGTASAPEEALAELYETTLETVGDWKDPEFSSGFRTILGAIAVAEEPLKADTIDEVLGHPNALPSIHTIESLGCVLTWTSNHPIRIVHPSFHDYITSTRCKDYPWYIDVSLHRRTLGVNCLYHVAEYLTRNPGKIGGLKSRDTARRDLSAGLQHAFRFWVEYVCTITDDVGVLAGDVATMLVSTRFLDWCTIVDIIWTRYIALDLTYKLLTWVKVRLPSFISRSRPLYS